MAWNDETDRLRRGPARRALDMGPIDQALDQGVSRYGDVADAAGQQLSALSTVSRTSTSAPSPAFEPAEYAINSRTGEIMLPNGEVLKATAPVIMQLATLELEDGGEIPKLTPEAMEAARQRGFRPYSKSQMQQNIASIPTESDFYREAYAAGKSTLGLIGSTIDSMFGNDDPSNSWSRASQDLGGSQTIGQYKASTGRW